MKQFVVKPEVWELFPEASFKVLVVNGMDNAVSADKTAEFQQLLAAAAQQARTFLTADVFSENEVVQEWREAFTRFKTKKGARSSIEALLKRANQGREFMPINPLVDVYNSVSLSYAVPCGGEDLAMIDGDLVLGIAAGGEDFLPLGSEENAPALEGELIYYDDKGAVCRCFNWREAERTMLRESTTDAILIMEALNPHQAERVEAAMKELQRLVKEYLNVDGNVLHLDGQQTVVTIA